MNGVTSKFDTAKLFAASVGFDGQSVAVLQDVVNTALVELAPREARLASELAEAIRYSLLAPGKRARALVVLLSAADMGVSVPSVIQPACAVELLHTASLVMDDLPCMDNAHVRRGLTSAHVRFGEDTAILAAITMLSDAYGLVARCATLDAHCKTDIIGQLSAAIGLDGLAAGQHLDLKTADEREMASRVEQIYRLKTGALFAAAWLGGRAATQEGVVLATLHEFGMKVGIAFQAYDDLADRLGSMETAGKDVRADVLKTTLVALEGANSAQARADETFEDALCDLARIGQDKGRLAHFVVELRDKLRSRMVSDAPA